MGRTTYVSNKFYGPNDVRAIEVRLYPDNAKVTKQHFPCPAWRNRVLVAVTSREIVVGNLFGRKTNLIYSVFSPQKHMKLARIKNLKNLNIGTDRPIQTV